MFTGKLRKGECEPTGAAVDTFQANFDRGVGDGGSMAGSQLSKLGILKYTMKMVNLEI